MKNSKTILVICFGLSLFASCSKSPSKTTADPNSQQHNEDITNIKSESDNNDADINSAMTSISGFGKNAAIQGFSICGAAIDSSHQYDAAPYIVLTFDGGTVCPNPSRIRSGQIKVQLISGAKWSDAGAQLQVTYTNYKVIFVGLNNHYITFNGVKYLTDVNGIDWVGLYLGTTTAQLRERSYNMMVTFDNGQQSSWNVARLSTWGISNYTNVYTTVNGDTTIGGKIIDSWGKTRYNTNFTVQMLQPWQSGTVCGWWSPTSGQYTSVTDNFTITATLGVNSSGNQVSSGCAYGFKLGWTVFASNSSGSVVLPYY